MDPNNNRTATLSSLKFHKSNSTSHSISSSSNATSMATNDVSPQRPIVMPPAQSRDATNSSRFWGTSTPLKGATVLAPNSSPISEPSSSTRPLISQTAPRIAAPAPIGKNAKPELFKFGGVRGFNDPLSAPTQFTNAHSVRTSSLTSSSTRLTPVVTPSSPLAARQDSYDAQESPQIKRPGKRRKLNQVDSDVSSDNDSTTQGSNGRLTRGTRPAAVGENKPSNDTLQFTMFKMTHPGISPDKISAAWNQVEGNAAAAEDLLRDPNWQPSREPSSDLTENDRIALYRIQQLHPGWDPAIVEATWRRCNKNIDEAALALFESQGGKVPPSSHPSSSSSSPNRKEQAYAREMEMKKKAAKEKENAMRKQSAIYARRDTLEVGKSATHPISIPDSPGSQALPPPRRIARKVKRVVADSDSGSQFGSESSEGEDVVESSARDSEYYETQVLGRFNEMQIDTLMGLTGCTRDQANAIASLRPFHDIEDLKTRLNQGRRKAGPAGLSPNIFEECVTIFRGYRTVDDVLDQCERIGADLKKIVDTWTASKSTSNKTEQEDGVIDLTELSSVVAKGFIRQQPTSLSPTVSLKEYQLIGLNWLKLLHSKRYSCILADEMGLGKTVQVISFLSHLKETGHVAGQGPHLIVVPASTLENWCREFDKFSPSLSYQTYYAGKDERPEMRDRLKNTVAYKQPGGWEILITTYTLAQGDEHDRKFFRKIPWETCIFDEGHQLKNFQSQRYLSLMGINANWRLLLTGTPLQNNLQELVSLMNFILPQLFAPAIDDLRSIFKVKADSAASLLSQERVTRAKKMMTPFVLRRRKDQVLRELPKKVERIEWCEMTPLQQTIYREALQRSRKLLVKVTSATATPDNLSSAEDSATSDAVTKKSKGKKAPPPKDTSSNVLMDLRKASSHPMLFRRRFTDQMLSSMARVLLKQPDFVKRGAVFDFVKEDMEVMTDSELQVFCDQHKATQKFALDPECYLDAGKINVLMSLLETYAEQNRRILVFSQFTQVLDILQALFNQHDIKFLILTGSTPVDARQALVDEFSEDESIRVFLLSTKAGGMGINLTAASVVILFDQDFNPHNDKQAADRSYRIGQKKDVEVIKLVTRGTIEEDMLRLAQTKLALDEAVAGEDGDSKAEKIMKESLMNTIRRQMADDEPSTS